MLRPRPLLRRRPRPHRRQKQHRRLTPHPRQKPLRRLKPHRRPTLHRRQRAQASKRYSPDVATVHAVASVIGEVPAGQPHDGLRHAVRKSHECFYSWLFCL